MRHDSKLNSAGVIGRNIVFNWIGFLAHALIVFFLTPFVLHQLGDVRYGVWALVMAITGYYGLVDLGLRSGVTQYLTRHLARGEVEGMNRSASTGFFLLAACGLLICGLSIALAVVAPPWLDPADEARRELALCILIVGAGTACQFFFFPFSAVFVATQRYDLSNIIGVVTRTIAAAAVWSALSLGGGLVALSAINAVGNLLDYLIRWRVSRRLLPELRIGWQYVDWSVCRQMFSYSAWAFLAQSTTRIAQSSGAVIVGLTMPLAAVGKYGLALTIVSFFQNFLGPAARVFFPVATHLDATGQNSRLRRIYAEGTRGMLLLIIVLGFVATLLAEDFFKLWVGERVSADVVAPFRILLLAAALSASQFLGTQVLLGRRAVETLAGLSATYTVLYLGLAIAWTARYGLLGIATAAAISAVALQVLAVPYYCCRTLDTSFRSYAAAAYARPLALTALLSIAYWQRGSYLPVADTWFALVVAASCATLFAATLAFAVGLSSVEKGRLVELLVRASPWGNRTLPSKS